MNKQQLAAKIWASANKMRSKIEANEYKDYILGFIFYKFLSDNEVRHLKEKALLEGPAEQTRIKNVALMMFSYHPEKFFPGTQIDFVFYPQGKDGDPNNFTETEPFRGPVHLTLRRALEYLKYMVVRKNIHKPKDDERSIVVYTYPFQALEESLVNAYYHRRYDEYQPVEVNIMPNMIEIISYGGAERSIKLEDLRVGMPISFMYHARLLHAISNSYVLRIS